MKKTKLILTGILILFFSLRGAASNDIYFSKIGIENGLSQLSVMTIYQDELGMLWFGTREGVNRYDGNSMEVFRPAPNDSNSLTGSLIKNICGDKNGHVYIHSQNGVNEFNLRTSSMRSLQREQVDAIAYGNRNLWIAERNVLCAYKDGKKKPHVAVKQCQSTIRTIYQTTDQRIFLGTTSSGVFVVDPDKKVRCLIPVSSQVSSFFEDSKKNIWIGTWQNGLYKIDRSGNIVNYVTGLKVNGTSLSSNFVRAICEDNKGFLWIGTKKGLDRLTPETSQFKHYDCEESNYRQLSNESVWSLLKDSQGTIWAGTYFGGVNYFNPDIDFYVFHDLQNGYFRNKPFPVISDIIEDKGHNLFLCTEGNGLIYYNPFARTYRSFKASEGNPNSLPCDNIKAGYYDPQNHELWLGMHLGGLCRLDLQNFRFTCFKTIKPGWEQSDIVRSIVPYRGNLLVATYNGLFVFDRKTGAFSLFSAGLHRKVSYFVDLKIDKDENMWIASRGLFCYNLKTGRLKSFFNNPEDSTSLSNNNTMKILIDSKQRVWVATNGGGVNLYNPEKGSFIRFNTGNSDLKNDYVSNLLESHTGSLIIATTQGFGILDLEKNKIFNYGAENGLPLNSLFNGGMCLRSNGEIFMAGMNGMVSFREENLTTPRRSFNVNLVNLWVNNKLVIPNDNSGVLDAALPYTHVIRLHHNQSMITIEFAANNYIQVNQPIYRYRLEGFSDGWTDLPQGFTKLNFMNLNPGKYKLYLEAVSPNDGLVIARTDLEIVVYPPFYLAWYAWLFYVGLIVFVVWRYLLFVRSKVLLKASLDYEKKEKEHLEEVNQSKLRFFTNISHEFRTPLTLITGQVDMLLQMHHIPPSIYSRILNIKRNTVNMQNLINELLEFRKSEQGHLNVKASQLDVVKFLYEIFLSFSEYAHFREIKFEFESKVDEIMLWFDPVQMQKVFYNLISNAFKYTPKEGSIRIVVEPASDAVEIKIFDTGIGISADAIEKIFDSFYQAENGLQIGNMPGTGIGLALTKNILEAHSANIQVESEPQAGSCFTVTLKKGEAHFTQEQKVERVDADASCLVQLDEIDSEFMQEVISTQAANNKGYSMLIVEDNAELRDMLKNIFEPMYTIYTASDGVEGLTLTLEHQPSIVLSDVMMPNMSGSEMCSKIKNNFAVCHIPVVLLTAQTAIEHNIEGLRLGADDYITKPFNIKTLIMRCNNLVNGRKLLQEKFSKQVGFSPRQIATNNMDQEFLEKAQEVIERNLDNNEFDVPAFSREMALGRTKLFSKIKGITGQTPNEFIITVKMKKAAALLTNNPEYNISDITYMLGFSSPKYFAKCFKEQFGMSPSTFRKGEGAVEEPEEEEESE